MTDELGEKLSSSGEARREAMLSELTAAMRRTHQGRRLLRRALGGGVCALAVVAIVRLSLISAPTPGGPSIQVEPSRPALESKAMAEKSRTSPKCVIERVSTDAAILARVAARPVRRPAILDDRTLVTALALIDRPAGLIRTGEQVRLSAPVTDAELEFQQ